MDTREKHFAMLTTTFCAASRVSCGIGANGEADPSEMEKVSMKELGIEDSFLSDATSGSSSACSRERTVGEPYTGNLYVRFDEGNGLTPVPTLLAKNQKENYASCPFVAKMRIHGQWVSFFAI